MKHKISYRDIKNLIGYSKNSRMHSDIQVQQIADSITEFGFTNPLLIDEKDQIIAGHGRLLAAEKVNMDQVPCVILRGLSETQKKALVIADNQLALNAGWDMDILKSELKELQLNEFDIDLLGFDDSFIADLLADNTEGLTDEDAVPDTPEVPITQPGDIWILGNHRLMCGDSTSIDEVETLMDGDLADQLITDPPYNVDYTGKTKDALKIDNDSMMDGDFRQFLKDAYSAADAVMKAGAVFYIWHADSEGYNFRGAANDIGWKIRQCLVWKKQSMVMGRQDYHWQHEPCLYGWKEGSSHLWATDRKQTTILEFNRPSRSDMHPTMKPVNLIEYQMLNNTKGSDIVLDLFGGSGTTMIAAEKNGRHSRLMELDPKYCDVIVRRWIQYTGKMAILESNGQKFDEVA